MVGVDVAARTVPARPQARPMFFWPRKSIADCTCAQSFSSKAMWCIWMRWPRTKLMVWWSGPQRRNTNQILDPVRDAEAQHLAVELRVLLAVVDAEGEMAELQRADARTCCGPVIAFCSAKRSRSRCPWGPRTPRPCRCRARRLERSSPPMPSASKPFLRSASEVAGRPGTTACCSATGRPCSAAPRGRRPWWRDARGRFPCRRRRGPAPARNSSVCCAVSGVSKVAWLKRLTWIMVPPDARSPSSRQKRSNLTGTCWVFAKWGEA